MWHMNQWGHQGQWGMQAQQHYQATASEYFVCSLCIQLIFLYIFALFNKVLFNFGLFFHTYPDNSPGGQFPTRTGFGPDEWFYSMVVVLVGSCPGGE